MKYYHKIILIRLKGDYIRFSAFLQLFQCFYSVFFHAICFSEEIAGINHYIEQLFDVFHAICFLKRLQELIFYIEQLFDVHFCSNTFCSSRNRGL